MRMTNKHGESPAAVQESVVTAALFLALSPDTAKQILQAIESHSDLFSAGRTNGEGRRG